MNAELNWDGLRVRVPAAWEPAVLERGFIRLADRDGRSIELRFGPDKGTFDPTRDGLRLLRAAGQGETALEPCREPWCMETRAEVLQGGRLRVLRFRESGGVVAALSSTLSPPEALRGLLTSMEWTPPDRWRDWACFDLRLATPPRAALARASFRPGAFRLDFRLGSSEVAFQRLAPADVLLAKSGLREWLERFLRREHDVEMTVSPLGDGEARFTARPGPLGRLLPGLPGTGPRLRGSARHDAGHNKLLILTERGRPCPQPVFDRLTASYAATTIQD